MYGENGIKVYFQEIDSMIQIKFKKTTDENEKLKIIKEVNPDIDISIPKNDRVWIVINKNNQPNYDDLIKNTSIVYANKSLLSEDGDIQIPTDKILVKIKSNYDLREILNKVGTEYESYERLGHDENSYLIILKDGESLNRANRLYESGYFEYAQPSFTRFMELMNEFYDDQWGLNNTGQNGGTEGIDINAPQAWTITRGCNNIRVAVIDQGVDLNHPDLAGNLLTGYDATDGGDGGVNGDCWGNDAHGTCCAGIIAAIDNTIGIVGVANNCRIVPIRVTYTSNGTQIWDDDWIVDAIDYAWEIADADILSCSWGGGGSVPAINAEITSALSQGRDNLGCVVVFASGNANGTVNYPANCNPDIISVGAMSHCGERKSPSSCDGEDWYRGYPYYDYLGGSNYGNELDLVAPGVFIPTTDLQDSEGYNTSVGTAGNYYLTFNGTSSATPHLAGVAALILSINPGLTQDQVRDIIESTCTKVGGYNYTTVAGRSNGTWHQEVGYGCVNALDAVAAVNPYITYSSFICSSSATFTVYRLPQGSSIVWEQSPNLQRVMPQGSNPCDFSVTANGSGWVKANVNLRDLQILYMW